MGELTSLEQLPLNIILQILTYLNIQDLQNVSRTCRTLRVLCNESIAYNRYLIEWTADSWRKRRLMYSFLAICNSRRNILRMMTNYSLTMAEALGYVHDRVRLGYSDLVYILDRSRQGLFKLGTEIEADSAKEAHTAGDNESSELPDTTMTELLGDQLENENTDISFAMASGIEPGDQEDADEYDYFTCPQSPGSALGVRVNAFEPRSKKRARGDDDGMTYLKILQGFHKVSSNTCGTQRQSLFDAAHDEVPVKQNDENCSDTDATPTKPYTGYAHRPRRCSSNANETSLSGPCSHELLSGESFHYSPHSSHGDSVSSIFSDTPRLSDPCNSRGWTMGFELDHISDGNFSGSDSSSSDEYIKQLQTSMKVREKAVLFEKLIAKGTEKAITKKCPAESADARRKISQSYLEELHRCNTASTLPSPDEIIANSKDWDRYGSPFFLDLWEAGKTSSRKHSLDASRRNAPQRRQLKAFVTDGNRICYERL
ncbi:AGR177Cp [Eremothecium gossypii ATCC 10895]|uniref:AGR177Cp n=1 Tax=Eremothecium gossypii (strain ATCC 10895 / CBS 109.51 / FGSC 9923 / NRRL Y-1056) TaxID=284811 RepID=Q74ZM1_EREGS|nr:AGR177Cp [Eremothecium gossypii ATCC 10895]AAS54667.2 AGR177Cp [Eremothecium gossypii ATCC 10895]AEY98997.1 FAGR177Cp [Eremothecium gossypii FDAG1]